MKKLFLLKADFQDVNFGTDQKFFCPDCALIEGVLSYYPKLRDELEVAYLGFARPRNVVVELIGEANQSLPVLILEDGSFINEPAEIIQHLTNNHQIGKSH